VAAGDFNNDGHDDLTAGVPREGVGSPEFWRAGAVNTIYGAPSGLNSLGAQLVSQDGPGIPGTAGRNDQFGRALTVANIGVDTPADLAVGVPGENLHRITDTGAVEIFYGADIVLSTGSGELWSQERVPGALEPGDYLGRVLQSSEAKFVLCASGSFPCDNF
jgi:hypothetical protein